MWGPPNIENFIPNRNVNLSYGANGCIANWGSLENITLQENGRSQTDKVNFPNTFPIDTKKITNTIQIFDTFKTNGLPNYDDYQSRYITEKNQGQLIFLLQITSLSNEVDDKIKETYLQAYYTNDVKLKIRISKRINANLSAFRTNYFGNDKNITIDVSNPNVLGIRNKSDSSVKITFKPR